jgi:hypothetical protein
MPADIKSIALVVSAILTAGCSGSARIAAPAPGAGAQPKPASQTLAAAKSAPAAATPPGSDVDHKLVKAGYSVMRRHNQVFYCRNEIITGNRIGTRVCLTAAQIQDEKQDVTKAKDLLNQPSYRCLGASCNN